MVDELCPDHFNLTCFSYLVLIICFFCQCNKERSSGGKTSKQSNKSCVCLHISELTNSYWLAAQRTHNNIQHRFMSLLLKSELVCREVHSQHNRRASDHKHLCKWFGKRAIQIISSDLLLNICMFSKRHGTKATPNTEPPIRAVPFSVQLALRLVDWGDLVQHLAKCTSARKPWCAHWLFPWLD